MAIPMFHQFFRPTLEVLRDSKARHWQEIQTAVADAFDLLPEEREELLPSQQRTRLADRVQWALTYLRQARLVESTGRGVTRITARGLKFLSGAPPIIRPSDLMQFTEFAEFQRRSRVDPDGSALPDQAHSELVTDAEQATPEEAIEAAYHKMNTALAQEIIERVKAMSPAFFERLIVRLMLKLGYGVATEESGYVLGKTGDGGVDGVINQDKLGLEKIYLQAKRWSDPSVGIKDIMAFVGALDGQGASKGVFMTTSSFSRDAADYARRVQRVKVSLVDGLQLATLMVEHDLGVSLVKRYDHKRVDSDFFMEE
jgi:restriction system protein